MREILFRGKRSDNGEWLYGYYVGPSGIIDDHEICDINDITGCRYEVDPSAVGQYTGLTDKNGKKIFEGDLIQNRDGDIGRVTWYPEHVAFMIYRKNRPMVFNIEGLDTDAVEVIGNIYDNPELLDGAYTE